MSGLRVERRLYADHWPIWCVVDESGRVLLCRQSEQEARKELETMRGKP